MLEQPNHQMNVTLVVVFLGLRGRGPTLLQIRCQSEGTPCGQRKLVSRTAGA